MTAVISAITTSTESALPALAWALAVAQGEAQLEDAPTPKPSLTAWRALELDTLREFMDQLLVAKEPEPGLEALQKIGVFDVWLPEVAGLVGFGDGEWRHKDVWKHTKLVVKQSVPRLEVRWGALLHDIGKPRTRKIEADGRVTFHGHSEVGAAMFRKRVADRLGFKGALRERIHFLILNHLRASQYDSAWTDTAVRRFYREMGDGLRDLLDLSRADITTKRPERRRRGVAQISALSQRIRALQALDNKVAPLPKGLGTRISQEFGVPPSKRLGDIRHQLECDVESGQLQAQQPIDYYVEWLRAHKEQYELA